MVKICSLNKNHFVGYGFAISKDTNGDLIAVPSRSVIQNSIVISGIEADSGTYLVVINVYSNCQLYWYGDYIGAKRMPLRNGSNAFYLKVDPKQMVPFVLGIFCSVNKASNKIIMKDFRIKNVNSAISQPIVTKSKPVSKPVEPVEPVKPVEDILTKCTDKRNILLVIDEGNWCFDNITKVIKKFYDNQYNIFVESCKSNPDYKEYRDLKIDLIVKFWYGYESDDDPFEIFPCSVKAVCVYDYIHWNNKITTSSNTRIYGNFLKNIRAADYILYACPMIKELLHSQYSIFIESKTLFPVYDGVDTTQFYQMYYKRNRELVVGWVGNMRVPKKNYLPLWRMLKATPWIKFVTQDKLNFIPHHKMPQFYHQVDVVVCVSDAEGTPNSILEASSCGRTWVSTNVGIVQMLYDLSKNDVKPGFIIDEQNELLAKLEFLHKNRTQMQRMGSMARECVTKFFSWKDRVKGFGDVFTAAVNKIKEDSIEKDTSTVTVNEILVVDNKKEATNGNTNVMTDNEKSVEIVSTDNEKSVEIVSTDKTDIIESNSELLNITTDNIVSTINSNIDIMSVFDYSQKIVITSTQYPRYGGAATSAYEMHKYFLSKSIQSVCVFFDNSVRNKSDMFNPDNLANVYNQPMPKSKNLISKARYDDIITKLYDTYGTEPFTIYAFNYFAPIISKNIFPDSTVNYMITGCNYINNNNLIDSSNFLSNRFDFRENISDEKSTFKMADAIIPVSNLSKNIFEHCYKCYTNDPIDLHEIYQIDDAKPDNAERYYDIAFICSNFTRKVKNIELVKNIFKNPGLSQYKKICIGKNSNQIIGASDDFNITCEDFLCQKEVSSIMNNTKIILVTSFIETFSITAIEATKCGCIILANKNAACASTINKYYVVDSYNIRDWIIKIKKVLNNYPYFKKIFINDFNKTPKIENLWKKKFDNGEKINVICCSVDVPYVGGCATNTYRIIKSLSSHNKFNVYGIFISNNDGNSNPDNLKNIYHLRYGKDTEMDLGTLKNKIISDLGKVHFVFCKNYKIFPFFKKIFSDTKIILSPSGLRNVSCSAATNYLLDIKLDTILEESKINFSNVNNIYKFIQENDIYLDEFALKQSDLVIPNSLVTYNIINSFYTDVPNLCYPINFTNIIYEREPLENFSNRQYEVIFCAYDWKRKCKNYAMVLEIISHERTRDMKILVVGKSQNKQTYQNVTKFDNIPNDQLFETLKKSKVVVIPSKFDSNPNVLIEAIMAGCNVVATNNIGNSENLDPRCIVEKYSTVNSWIDTIISCTKKRMEYYGPTKSKIMADIVKIFSENSEYKKSVGIYKIPPELSNSITKGFFNKISNIDFVKARDMTFALDIIKYDIYFNIFMEISKKEGCTSINYIFFDDTIKKNLYYNVNNIYPFFPKGVTIWKLKDIESYIYFANADVYLVRGTYYNFFNELIPTSAKTFFYPATSLKQSLIDDGTKRVLTNQKFNIVFQHSDTPLRDVYIADKFIDLDKFATDEFVCYNCGERKYDICYVATEKQKTKNHDLFLHLILYLEKIKYQCNIIYVGDLIRIIQDNRIQGFENFIYVNVFNQNNCSHQQLIKIYNNSRINILFSGRDALPRVISESAACGCYNVALDTLSDGKNFYDGVLGSLIGDPGVKKVLRKSASISYLPDEKLWIMIIDCINKKYEHSQISSLFKAKYNLDNLMARIYQ